MGARTGLEAISRVLADPGTAVPTLVRGTMALLVDEQAGPHLLCHAARQADIR